MSCCFTISHPTGILVETLPGATDENIEKAIANLEVIQAKGLGSYLYRTPEEKKLLLAKRTERYRQGCNAG